MKEIPTSEEYFKPFRDEDGQYGYRDIERHLREFAKLHVNAALKEALESIPCLGSSSDIPTYKEVEEAVLNCYPENLIQ